MEINIKIEDNNLTNFSQSAIKTLEEQTQDYTLEIVKEANLIGEGNCEEGAKCEITSSTIMQATKTKRFRGLPKKKSKLLVCCKILSAFFGCITGFLFDVTGYQDNPWGLILFAVSLLVTAVTTAFVIAKE